MEYVAMKTEFKLRMRVSSFYRHLTRTILIRTFQRPQFIGQSDVQVYLAGRAISIGYETLIYNYFTYTWKVRSHYTRI